jgi:putative Mn2+ efflux pump MntP
MIYEGIKNKDEACCGSLTVITVIVQGVATSIDALSVGFTVSDYNFLEAFLCAGIIAALTFVICLAGIIIGKRAGTHLSGKACIFGGAILVFIGLEIFITGLL